MCLGQLEFILLSKTTFNLSSFQHTQLLSKYLRPFLCQRGEKANQGKPGLCSSRIYSLAEDRPMVISKPDESWDGKEQHAKEQIVLAR